MIKTFNLKLKLKLIFYCLVLLGITFELLISSPNTGYKILAAGQPCVIQSTVSARATGLVSARSFSNTTQTKFGTLNGVCVVNAQAAISPTATFDQLKADYYDKANSISGVVNKNNIDTTIISPNETNISLTGTDQLYYFPNTLTLNGSKPSTWTTSGLIFVGQDLIFKTTSSTPNFTNSNSRHTLAFVVKGNVYIDKDYKNLDAFIIAAGKIYTDIDTSVGVASSWNCSNTIYSSTSFSLSTLNINGGLISLPGGEITLCRNLSNNINPSEVITLEPKLLPLLRNVFAIDYSQRVDNQVLGLYSGVPATAPPVGATTTIPNSNPPAASTAYFYDDALASGFQNWTWGSTIAFNGTTPYSGTNNINWDTTSGTSTYPALYLHTDTSAINLTPYTNLTFAISSTTPNVSTTVQLFYTDSTSSPLLNIAGLTSTYQLYTFSLASLNGTGKSVKEIQIKDQTGVGGHSYKVDQIRVEGAGAASPTPSPLPTPSGPVDNTPPTISNVVASAITQTSATISWATNEASDSQVEYGLTLPYSSSTTLNSSLVTSHSQNLTGLTPARTYHYRVNSHDAAGNLQVSSDLTFTTQSPPDTTVPTISLTSPTANSTVRGSSISLSANASDNIGVVGVQFKVDGTNFGAEDLTNPYSLNWNTLTATNSTHTISATARDAAGNTTTTPSITVTVDNYLRVFVTSGSWTGDLKTAGSNVGLGAATDGFDGADKLCQAEANSASLGGTWKAWLSDSTSANYAINRLAHNSGKPIKTLNGSQVAADLDSLALAGQLSSGINQTPSGSLIGTNSVDESWTATKPDGTFNSNSSSCNSWTTSSNSNARVGSTWKSGTGNWTSDNGISCSNIRHLACFEQ